MDSKNKTKLIMVQGTSSNAGKSVVVAALCRIFSKRGYKVAPFKSQNMSLNSYTTKENAEIAIAQVLQAEAAGVEPSYNMNPILLKPKEDFISQVIVHGKPVNDMNFYDYQNSFRKKALQAINESLETLKKEYDIIVIEGAGSPAEINMQDKDLANMKIAEIADADVILVADIDRGGVFASIAGTFSLLEEKYRKRIKGIIINKFRGNLDILIPGIRQIEEIVGVPVLGVIPYDRSLKLPEEDSASLSERKYSKNEKINIGVMRLLKISNFTDIDPLEYEQDIGIKMIEMGDEIGKVDALVIPGTRNTINDMIALNEAGFTDEIVNLASEIPVFGICGGYQILGTKIIDETFKESKYGSVEGIGLLDAKTKFERIDKIVTQSKAHILGNGMFKSIKGSSVKGYELHEGLTVLGKSKPMFKIIQGVGNHPSSPYDGAVEGYVMGTYLHGIFHNYKFRRTFTDYLRVQNGLDALGFSEDNFESLKKFSIDRLAEIVEENVDLSIIEESIEKRIS